MDTHNLAVCFGPTLCPIPHGKVVNQPELSSNTVGSIKTQRFEKYYTRLGTSIYNLQHLGSSIKQPTQNYEATQANVNLGVV